MLHCHYWRWSYTTAASAQAAASHPARGHMLPLSSPARPEGTVLVRRQSCRGAFTWACAVFQHLLPGKVVRHFRLPKPCCLDAACCVRWLTRSEDKSSTGSCRSLCICCPLRHLLRIRKLKGRPGPRKGRSTGMICTQTSELTAQTFCGRVWCSLAAERQAGAQTSCKCGVQIAFSNEMRQVQPAEPGVLALGATSSMDVKVFSIMTAFTA